MFLAYRSEIGNIITVCAGSPIMVQTSIGPQIDYDRRRLAEIVLVREVGHPELVLAKTLPLPGGRCWFTEAGQPAE